MDTWRLIPFSRHDAFENMAIDEAVLRCHSADRIPTLRFYGWERESVSLGYFQDVERELNCSLCRRQHIDIVRRPTGGKAVLHGSDLTYAVVASASQPPFSPRVLETYRVISECLIRGLEKAGIRADMVREGRSVHAGEGDSCCFAVPVQYELCVGEKKICGSAQVRVRDAFLQHGSIPLTFDGLRSRMIMGLQGGEHGGVPDALTRSVTSLQEQLEDRASVERLCEHLAGGFEEYMKVRLILADLDRDEEIMKEELLRKKYSQLQWNMKGLMVM